MDKIGFLIDARYTSRTKTESERVMESLVEEFTSRGESAIEYLFEYVKTAPLTRWSLTVMKVLQRIGYPANHKALPLIVDMAGNINAPGYDIALEMVKELGEPAIPHIREGLQFYLQDCDEYDLMIQGYCVMAEEIGSPEIDPLLPDLLHLLQIGTDGYTAGVYALWPIRKIGSPKANIAIPLIAEKIKSSQSEYVRKVMIEALLDFDPVATKPLRPILRECLNDETEDVQASARKVLAFLEEKTYHALAQA